MLAVRRAPDVPLSVGSFQGACDLDQVRGEVQRAYLDGDLSFGQSRLFLIDPDTPSQDVRLSDLTCVKDEIRGLEGRTAALPEFLSVFAVAQPHHRVAVEVYKLMWTLEAKGRVMPSFRIVDTFGEADFLLSKVLGLRQGMLAAQLAALNVTFPHIRTEGAA